jgi:hypothetical protein
METPDRRSGYDLVAEPISPEIVAFTKATKQAAANAQLTDPVSAVPTRWLMAISGDIEQVDTGGAVGVASWPASHKVLSFVAGAGAQMGLTALSPEDDSTPSERLRQYVMSQSMLGTPNVEGSDEFASVGELLRAAAYLKRREAFTPLVYHQAHVATHHHAIPDVAVRRRFCELAAQWRSETALESSVNRKAMNWSYQQMIGLGAAALPLVLAELERETDDWFWALAAIAGEDPAEGAETLEAATEAWLDWGRREGHLDEPAG